MNEVKRRSLGLFSACLLIALTNRAFADQLPRARPEDVGFSSTRLDYIDQFYGEKIKRGDMAGVVTLIARHGKIVHFTALGYADLEKKQKMETDTIFRLYSMTKPVASVALMMLYEEGRFQLRDPVSMYIPEFGNLRVLRTPDAPFDETVAPKHPPTMQDVMRHTAGFTHGLATDAFDNQYTKASVFGLDVSLAEMMTKLSKIPLRYQPETKFVYSVGPDVAARLVEVLSGMPFDEFLEKRLFEPLGMKDAGFWVPPSKAGRLATVYWTKDGKLRPLDEAHGHPEGGILVQPWSVNSYTVNHKHKGGSFGLVSTTEDYWRFAQMMLNGGVLNGTRVLSPQVVHFMTRDHLGTIPIDDPGEPASGIGFGLGFGVVKDAAEFGGMPSDGSYFWGGAADTTFWIDPKQDLVVVAMTQHMDVPGAELGSLGALVYSALLE